MIIIIVDPVRARILRRAENYAWNSAAGHCGLREDPVVWPLPQGSPATTKEWSAWLAEEDDAQMMKTLRLNTRTGRPAGGKQFVADLEARLGRRLAPRHVGRPKKSPS